MRASLPLLALLCCILQASWVCPVFRARSIDTGDPAGLPATASLGCWEVVITPTPSTEGEACGLAHWDYMISERLSMNPAGGSGSITFCLDLGVVPEGCRSVLSASSAGIELPACSTLARPFYEADRAAVGDTLYVVRRDPFHPSNTVYVLDDMESYRSLFGSEEDFLSAVPETARSFALLYSIPVDGEPFDVEVVYLSRGWSYLAGAEPLVFSLLEPCLWAGPVTEASIVVDMAGVADRDEWRIGFMGEEFGGGAALRFRVGDLDVQDVGSCPVLTITPPGMAGI